MKDLSPDKKHESSSLMNGKRKYFRMGISPDSNSHIGASIRRSNKQIVWPMVPYLQSAVNALSRKNRYSFTNSSTKIGQKQDNFLSGQLQAIQNSRNFLSEHRKGKSSFHNKLKGIGLDMALVEIVKGQRGKQLKKVNSEQPRTMDLQAKQLQLEQLHYSMVQYQQKCRKKIAN